MKRLFISLVALVGVFMLSAAECALLSKAPESTAGALYFDVAKLMQSKELAKLAKDSFFTDLTKDECPVAEVLIFTTSKPKLINAALVRLNKALDLAQNLKQHHLAFTEGVMEGKHAWFVKQACLCEELVIVEVEPQLYLLAGKRRAAQMVLQMKTGTSPIVTAQLAKLVIADAPVWYVDTGVKLPARSTDKKKKKTRGDIRMCFDPFCGGETGKFHLLVACPDASCASQMAVLVPLTSGVVCGVLFSDDQALNERVMGRIVPALQGSEFSVSAEIPPDLMHDIHTYFKERDLVQMIQSAIDLANL